MQPTDKIGFECPDSSPKRQRIESESVTFCNRVKQVNEWPMHGLVRQKAFLDIQ